jgi:hypothetical protein
MLGHLRLISFLTLNALGFAGAGWACACTRVFFDEKVKHSSVVLLGQVRTQGMRASSSEVAYLDVEVVQVLKGRLTDREVRIWDSLPGTSCSIGLDRLDPGTLAVFAVEENKEPSTEVRDRSGIQPEADDYLTSPCSENWRVFKTERGARQYMKRHIH